MRPCCFDAYHGWVARINEFCCQVLICASEVDYSRCFHLSFPVLRLSFSTNYKQPGSQSNTLLEYQWFKSSQSEIRLFSLNPLSKNGCTPFAL